jgi:hypothetical protein
LYLNHKNTRSRTFLTRCQPLLRARSWRNWQRGEETATVTGPRSVRAARTRSKFQILTGAGAGGRRDAHRTASRATRSLRAPRPVTRSTPPQLAGPAGQPHKDPHPPTTGPACHRLRGGGEWVGAWVVGSLKKGVGAVSHHTATPHLPSIRLHTPALSSPSHTSPPRPCLFRERKPPPHPAS